MKYITTEEFIKRAKEVHGDKYDYSKVEYKNTNTKICIICPKHGEFWQTPNNHINQKQGCPKCAHRSYKKDINEFIEEAREIHGDKYDYSKVEYKNNRTKICIICSEHGEFQQTPYKHLLGQGCPNCCGNKKLTTEEFIEKACKIHGNKYDYSKVKYVNSETKVCIICPKHGEFYQTPHSHLTGEGCPKCCKTLKTTTKEFIKKAREIHGDKYDYSKVEYKNNKTPVCIICPEHGEFWQAPNNHLSQKQGCPKCAELINVSETNLFNFIKENTKYEIKRQKTFKWLGNKKIDIFIENLNLGIEYQGKQHFKPNEKFGGEEGYKNTIKWDSEKYYLCKKHGIKILYVSYEKDLPLNYFDTIYRSNNDVLKEIKKYDKDN